MKPDDTIPGDVKRAALVAMEAAYHPAKSSTDQIIDAVCSAIMAERERCAKVVEDHAIVDGSEGQTLRHRNDGNRAGLAYAAAIRKGQPN